MFKLSLFHKIQVLRGQSLIELMLAIGLAAIILPALATGLISSRNGKAQESQRLQASALLLETDTAVRSIRSRDWSQFAVDGTYHTATQSGHWKWEVGPYTDSNGLTQKVVISDVNRNSSGAITASGGKPDPSTKLVTITISWANPLPTSIISTMYFTRAENMDTLQKAGYDIDPNDKKRLYPLGHGYINIVGKYSFNISEEVLKGNLRPLKQIDNKLFGNS